MNASEYSNLKKYRKELKSFLPKQRNQTILFASVSLLSFLFWFFELYMHNSVIIEERSLTVKLILSTDPNKLYMWFESIMIIFNMIWPLVNGAFLYRKALERYKNLKKITYKMQYATVKINNFEKDQENLPRKDFNDLLYDN